jgi:hypothetical protein
MITINICVGFEVLTEVTMKSTVFWDMTPCSQKKFTDVSEEHMPPSSQVKNNPSKQNKIQGRKIWFG